MDFEKAMHIGFTAVFPEIQLIGCLFHFKQALYRYAAKNGCTTNEEKDSTIQLIDLIGKVCFKED